MRGCVRIRIRFSDSKFASGCKFVSATIRDGYKFELGRRLGVHVVVAVKSALVIVFLDAVGGALQFLLVFLLEGMEYSFRDIYFQCPVFEKIGKMPWQKTVL